MTKFTLEKLTVAGLDFWFDGNSKITLDNTYKNPTANAFSLPHITDCPFATRVCAKDCYVNGLQETQPDLYEKYAVNSLSLKKVLDNQRSWSHCEAAFSDWIRAHASKGFRWHVSGDIISWTHANFIASVCNGAMEVPFWIYTRSFVFVPPLMTVPNLVINLSVDIENYREGRKLRDRLLESSGRELRLCYMTVDGERPADIPKGSVLFPSYALGRNRHQERDDDWWNGLTLDEKKMVCPPDVFGQSETFRCGPCKKCLT